MRTHNIPSCYRKSERYPTMPPGLALWLTLICSNYPCLEHLFMVQKVFEPLKLGLYFFPYKNLSDKIWPWHKIGQGQPRIIIWISYTLPTFPVLHTMFHCNWPTGPGEEDFWSVFTIYGRCSHLGHVTKTICLHFLKCAPKIFKWYLVSNNSTVLRKKARFKFEKRVTFAQGQEYLAAHAAALDHSVQCIYQLWDHRL